MRTMFGCLAALLCVVSVALAARYGYKGADTEVDGAISAIVFGLIALCACLFDAAAVRLWFMGHRIGASSIGVIAAAALLVTSLTAWVPSPAARTAPRLSATEPRRMRLTVAPNWGESRGSAKASHSCPRPTMP
jgi:hypothetical protein